MTEFFLTQWGMTAFYERQNLGKNNYGSIKQNPWETDRCTASLEIPKFFWNLKVHYHTHKNLPIVCILRQIQPNPHIYFDTILQDLPRNLSLSRFPNKILYAFLVYPHISPTHLILDFTTIIIFAEEYKSLSPFSCNFSSLLLPPLP
jgi:hypothetical protein